MKKFVSVILLIAYTFPALCHDGNDGWVTIENFKLWSNTYETDSIRIQVTDGYYNPAESCSDPDSYMVGSELSKEAQARLYSTLLAANLASRPVTVFINTSTCERNRPKIMNVVVG